MAKKKKSVSKKEHFLQKLERKVTNFLSSLGFEVLSWDQLVEALDIPKSQETLLQEALDQLVERNILRISDKGYRLSQKSADVITGTLRVHPRGFGFLQCDDATLYQEDIFIPKHLTQNAVDGDRVEVVVNQHSVSAKGPEGRVINILSRGRTHLAGIIMNVFKNGKAQAYVPLLGIDQNVVVESNDLELRTGDRIVMEVFQWGEEGGDTKCKASHHIGHISDPSCDIKAAIEEYEIRNQFPTRVIQEAKKFGDQVTEKELEGREDFRKVETFTIDPDTAKDFDDALTLSKDKKGNYHLIVHIADVSHYVQPGSALDDEARDRCNSTYFPQVCIPMLPPELSENLCSLCPDEDRLTVSVLVDFDKDGNQLNYKITRSVIRSVKRFTYKEAKQVLDGKIKSPHVKTLKLMVELCQLLKKKRYERGSIEFAMPELVVRVDKKGVPTGTDYIEYDITHQLVEEFMLKANEIVATHLSKQGKNLAYRVHEQPASEGLKDFSMIASAFGYKLSEVPTTQELQQMFEDTLNQPFGEFLATSYIRRMRMAVYAANNIGHYGLMLTHYCHFTSPIRRYIDLTVHRVLFGEADNRETLATIAQLCSEQERISSRAESSVVQLKKLRLLSSIKKEDSKRQFEAIVTRVKPFGILFEVLEFMLEGFLHVSELENDYYVFDNVNMILKGDYSGGQFRAGDKIHVMLKNVNLILQESQWYLVATTTSKKRKRKK